MIASVQYQPITKAAQKRLISFKVAASSKTLSNKKSPVNIFIKKAEKAGNDGYSDCIKQCLTDYEGIVVDFNPKKVSLLLTSFNLNVNLYVTVREESNKRRGWLASPNVILIIRVKLRQRNTKQIKIHLQSGRSSSHIKLSMLWRWHKKFSLMFQ